MSYGSRGEILNASRSLALDAVRGNLDVTKIDETVFQERLLTLHCGDPDILLSGRQGNMNKQLHVVGNWPIQKCFSSKTLASH